MCTALCTHISNGNHLHCKSIAEFLGNEGDIDALISFSKANKLCNDIQIFGFLLLMGNPYVELVSL